MARDILLLATVAVALVGFSNGTSAQQQPPPRTGINQSGRYQLVHSEPQLFLIDTISGQCWSRMGGDWIDEGNPTQTRSPNLQSKVERSAPKLDLPEESVAMTVVQREESSIPGSGGSVRVRVGDIADGQVQLSIGTDDDANLLKPMSVAKGDTVRFSVGEEKYTASIEELRDVEMGNDFAKITISKVAE